MSSLICSSERTFEKEGILSRPRETERIIRSSEIVFCHFAFERSRAPFFFPSSVSPLPSAPWHFSQFSFQSFPYQVMC